MANLPTLKSIESAAAIVHSFMPPTPQIRWPLLCARTVADVWVKHENHGPVGAFKLRGGLVYIDELRLREPHVSGVIAATRGNHGQSIALAAARAGLRAAIVVPYGNSPEKNAAMRSLGAQLIEYGRDFQEAFEHASQLAGLENLHFVPSFHPSLVRGVATYALELFHAVGNLDTVYVPIGMGSGICGCIAARDALGLETEIVGVTALNAPAFARSFAVRRSISAVVEPTVADGMACREVDPIALKLVSKGASRIVALTEGEIHEAMRYFFSDTHNVAEGAGAAALAALLRESEQMRGRRVAVVLSGGNVDSDVFGRILLES